ncbi:MAG: 50S ribosomal protein L19 [Bacteroidetes bacterium]|nr:50S ribosomal protein L19 [Bacteroidota bacterium]
MDLVKIAEQSFVEKRETPGFKAGDTVTVFYKIIEGNKERIQQYQGVVLQRKGSGMTETFTVRKISNGVGVERIFPVQSPKIDKIVIDKRGIVRRARIFYLRNISGKKARIEEKDHNLFSIKFRTSCENGRFFLCLRAGVMS